MSSPLGAAGALASSFTWAYASTRYAKASRSLGVVRLNLLRALAVLPAYLVAALLTRPAGGALFAGVTAGRAAWLFASVLCSYGLADAMFFLSATRLGVSTALSVASIYPLWAALVGTFVHGEPFGPLRQLGTVACVAGVSVLVSRSADRHQAGRAAPDLVGVALALLTSLLWAGNSVSIKRGAVGISVWQANLVRYIMTAALLAPVHAWLRLRQPRAASAAAPPRTASLIAVIYLDAFFGSVFYVYGLGHTDLAVGATLSSLAPLVSVPVAIRLGEERWSPVRFGAMAAAVTGAVVLVVG